MKNIITYKVIKSILSSIFLVLPIHIGTGILFPSFGIYELNNYSLLAYQEVAKSDSNVVLMDLKKEYCDVLCHLLDNEETIEFLTKTFGVDKSKIYDDLVERNKDEKYIINNVGRLEDKKGELKDFCSFEKGFIEYLYDYAKKHPINISKDYTPYEGKADYVVDLIRYFTKIYDNVDYLTAVSIGAHESGYYKVKYMLRYNNIYGGMSSSGLIKHKNIEYGVLSYIRLLSIYYYGKGLNTVESIGKVYCPSKIDGKVVARPSWVKNVKIAMNYYKDTYEEVSVSKLINGEY